MADSREHRDALEQEEVAALATATDEDLLLYISCQDPEDLPLAKAAFDEFYARHVDYVFGACNRLGGIVGRVGVEDLVQITFLHVWRYAAGRFKSCTDGAPEAQTAYTRAWLGVIAKRLFLGLLRREPAATHFPIEEFDGAIPAAHDDADHEESVAASNVRTALESELTERERDIVLVSMRFAKPDGTLARLPADVLAYLENRWSTTRENIRKIRQRAIVKLRRAFAASRTSVEERRSNGK